MGEGKNPGHIHPIHSPACSQVGEGIYPYVVEELRSVRVTVSYQPKPTTVSASAYE